MDLTDKIKQILVDKNITPSLFADEIGIQRSSMSHILAGRNKPSLDMVQKIVKRFPDLGISWILDDEPLPVTTPVAIPEPVLESRKKVVSVPQPAQPIVAKEKPVVLPEKKIEKVLIFYSDGTFQEFKQG
ncbi:transcriptional regulator with XRE-family HTH domain [Dyadobacter sp. BE34]|uniref:Transcriptional regulator with XRE-family HTH domain n=1 Tax=Dyadobacter fermentans TaxID=94254 RepID=A0ABU1QXD4_9BACT|nr:MULTISPECIES: helix-turn-helix transcriptional regulator [Dyadobacter]MDR6805828.1 transcriptional regulator with XRE-family HTH domain [Dyadobacter fermentans]MDR7042411.1 transcriptional regulator with XRE-family HTH domain [Dyadobacter sp. BE242]MDR7196724.1 transcriptional regulator with XRE-family HTH domain [Dyadobacter sp. BE34]MDR7215842.1 transcriptional regulator with XRE-family HTH domain [Dyadobacter sp. BE31]MDR7263378.1 transcriptional regulator with XRE-family HTH domain [Dya